MAEDTLPSQEPAPVHHSEVKLRRADFYPDFISSGMTLKEAEELCALIQAIY